MSLPRVTRVSECLIKPLHASPKPNQPIHLTSSELFVVNFNYSQKGLLFSKPSAQDFSIAAYLDDLKHSLSATLTHFPSLSARLATQIHQNPPSCFIYVDPQNNPGVGFVYATAAEATISDILSPIDVPPVVHSLFDLNDAINHDGHTLPLLSIQVTELADGIFIGGSINHMVADGASFWHFMAPWSEIFRSSHGNNTPLTISRPPKRTQPDLIINLPYTDPSQFISKFQRQPFQERFFHFSLVSLSKLKSKANSESSSGKISSFQAVSALFWRCITRARRLTDDKDTSCTFMINNRSRLSPPVSDDYFGNLIQLGKGTAKVGDLLTRGLGWGAMKLHEAVVNHDDRAVKESSESWARNPVVPQLSRLEDLTDVHVGSSPRFDMYGCEFGLGKAVAARSGITNKIDGKLTMFPGREGGGSVDVEVCLSPEHMLRIATDEELLDALNVSNE